MGRYASRRRLTAGLLSRSGFLTALVAIALTAAGCFGGSSGSTVQYASISGRVTLASTSPAGLTRPSAQPAPSTRQGGSTATVTFATSLFSSRDNQDSRRIIVEADAVTTPAEMDRLARTFGARESRPVAGPGSGFFVWLFDGPINDKDVHRILRAASPQVRSAQLERKIVPMGLTTDPRYSEQWALPRIHAPDAWKTAQGSGVVVAILDTAIDMHHVDLDDPNRWVDGCDFVDRIGGTCTPYGYNTSYVPSVEHGTAVAGIIGALTGNTEGIKAVAPAVKLMPLRVIGPKSGSEADLADAIRWGADHGADVLNMSLGMTCSGCQAGSALSSAIEYAHAKGVILVGAAGNDGGGPIKVPANHPDVIAVGASDRNDAKAPVSNTGPELDLAAPGVDIYSTYPGDQYRWLSGTSMAVPHVAGAAAILLSNGVEPAGVREALTYSAQDIGPLGRDDATGCGLLDIAAALDPKVPVVFVAEDRSDILFSKTGHVQPLCDGSYQITRVPQGQWTLVGWVDTNHNDRIDNGDYYGHSTYDFSGGSNYTINFQLDLYSGSPIQVQ